jgi:hypothetical protein
MDWMPTTERAWIGFLILDERKICTSPMRQRKSARDGSFCTVFSVVEQSKSSQSTNGLEENMVEELRPFMVEMTNLALRCILMTLRSQSSNGVVPDLLPFP